MLRYFLLKSMWVGINLRKRENCAIWKESGMGEYKSHSLSINVSNLKPALPMHKIVLKHSILFHWELLHVPYEKNILWKSMRIEYHFPNGMFCLKFDCGRRKFHQYVSITWEYSAGFSWYFHIIMRNHCLQKRFT